MLYNFNEILVDDTKSCKKIKNQDYLKTGKYPIIDQGQKKVSGYWNDENDLYEDVPAIIFGDHTRIVKYVDKPFFIGADGVKVLKCKIKDVNYKYLFYLLKSIHIPNTGYNRHFKWIKNSQFDIHSIKDQKCIVSTLESISNIINIRKQQLEKLDLLVKAKFSEMFGDPLLNTKNYALSNFGNKFSLSAGGTPSKKIDEYWVGGSIPWIGSNMCKNEYIYKADNKFITEAGLKHSSAKIFKPNTVLVALVGATIGKVGLLKTSLCTNQNVLGISNIIENGYVPEFIFVYLQGLYNKFLELGEGKFAMASKSFVSDLPLPVVDLSIQTSFSNFLNIVNINKNKISESIKEYSLLQSSLMQKYFRGE